MLFMSYWRKPALTAWAFGGGGGGEGAASDVEGRGGEAAAAVAADGYGVAAFVRRGGAAYFRHSDMGWRDPQGFLCLAGRRDDRLALPSGVKVSRVCSSTDCHRTLRPSALRCPPA